MKKELAEHSTVIGLGLMCIATLLGFLVQLKQGPFLALDVAIRALFYPPASGSAFAAMYFATLLGSFWPIFFFTSIATLFFFLKNHYVDALTWIGTVSVTGILSGALKYFFLIPRPGGGLVDSVGPGYPSGHTAAISAVMTLALLWAIRHSKNNALHAAAGILTFSIVCAVGISRIYLGVHWPSDVLGGLLLGSGTAFAITGLSHLVK